MQIQVNTDNHTVGSAELTRQVEAVVEGTLGRFGDRITRVEVHLSDENSSQKSGEKDKRCVMEARLAGHQPITVSHQGSSVEQALDGAADTLEKTLKRNLRRKDSLFKRRARARTEFTDVDPLLQRGAEIGNQKEFLTLLRPLLGHLRDHATRELRMLEMNELFPRDQVTADDLLDEVMARAWLRFAGRPREIPLDLWLVNLLDETLDEKIEPESRTKKSLNQHADEVHSKDLHQVDDQEWWVWLLGEDETISLGDAISSGEGTAAAEQVKSRDLKDRIHALLGAMPKAQRQAFVLHILEAYELYEVAMIQDRAETEVQADIEAARNILREVHLLRGDVH
ncbi:MAG: HPF/RaiA family ribosome-associated protein [Planctomycetales bacterium]|nr:HPF/RaiA family ribosome-associated protein [Planctomycetales bacterium]